MQFRFTILKGLRPLKHPFVGLRPPISPGGFELLPVAAALGAVCGDSSLGLEVLSGLTPEAVERAKELVSEGCVHISVADTEHLLYVKATDSMILDIMLCK